MAANTTIAPPDSAEARRYNRIRRWLGIGEFALSLALLMVLVTTGWTFKLQNLAYLGGLIQSYSFALFVYVMMLLVIGKVLGLGMDYYSFRLEHRYQLSNQKFRGWAWDEVKGFLVSAILAAVLVELLYFVIRHAQYWWLVAWLGFLGVVVLLAQLAPVVLFPIFYKFEPLQDEELKLRLVRLGERAGTRVRGVYKWHLSEKSKKANAALTGLGNTRRIILADTLLDNYSADEVEAVLAHELGHHVHKHILKSIGIQAGVTLIGFWAANWTLHYAIERRHIFVSLSDFANLPLLLLIFAVLSFLLMPALNAFSRFNERQADRYAFENIASVAPFISSMNKLAEQNLAERTPSRWVEWWFHSHPAFARRVAAAEQWEKAIAR